MASRKAGKQSVLPVGSEGSAEPTMMFVDAAADRRDLAVRYYNLTVVGIDLLFDEALKSPVVLEQMREVANDMVERLGTYFAR